MIANQTGNSGEEICSRFAQLEGGRGNWESHWQEISERVLPSHSRTFMQQNMGSLDGDKRNTLMIDATASMALDRFAAAMESMLTPRNQRWHGLRATLPELNKVRAVRLWFDEVADILFRYRYANKANFASQQHETYLMLGAFGTGAMFIDQLDRRDGGGLRYKSIHLAEVFFCENHQGVIDTVFRKFPLTARQALMQFGEDNPALPDTIKKGMDKNPEQEFWFLHHVCPREDYDSERMDAKGMPYASSYVCLDNKMIVKESGFQSFPYAVSRYVTAPGEIYGRSPAMTVLPNIKILNEQKKTLLKQGHRAVDPVLLAHDDGVMDTLSLKPGAINYGGVSAEGRALVHALPVGNLAVGKDMMDDERAIINDAFLVTMFQILVDTPQMTATEVLERAREKGALLSPTMGRQQSELLGPMIERELSLLRDQRLLPEMPGELIEAAGEYEIAYDSPLSRAQKAEDAAGLMRTAEFAVQVAVNTQSPEPLDWMNWDVIIPELADINAVPARWMRGAQEIQAIRQGRQQQMAAQQMTQALPGIAAMTKAVQP